MLSLVPLYSLRDSELKHPRTAWRQAQRVPRSAVLAKRQRIETLSFGPETAVGSSSAVLAKRQRIETERTNGGFDVVAVPLYSLRDSEMKPRGRSARRP